MLALKWAELEIVNAQIKQLQSQHSLALRLHNVDCVKTIGKEMHGVTLARKQLDED